MSDLSKKIVPAVCLVVVSVWLGGTLLAQAPGGEEGRIARELSQLKQRWTAAFKKQSAEGIAQLYDAGGAILTHSGRTVLGRDQILKAMANEMELMGPTDAALKAQNIHLLEGLVYETGIYSFSYTGNRQEKSLTRGRYVLIWRKGPEGWRIFRYIGLPD